MHASEAYPDGIISEKQILLEELLSSKANKTLLGVWSSNTGSQMLLCTVENIRDGKAENDKVVVVQERNLEGKHLSTHVLYLNEISKIHRFKKMDHDGQED
jgi:hypothetical protein